MNDIRIVLSTLDDFQKAEQLAETLVGERLAACVNIIPNVSSVYKWKGKVEQAVECLLVLKTSGDRLKAMTDRLLQIHPYDVPEVVVLPLEGGHRPYLDWVVAETRE